VTAEYGDAAQASFFDRDATRRSGPLVGTEVAEIQFAAETGTSAIFASAAEYERLESRGRGRLRRRCWSRGRTRGSGLCAEREWYLGVERAVWATPLCCRRKRCEVKVRLGSLGWPFFAVLIAFIFI